MKKPLKIAAAVLLVLVLALILWPRRNGAIHDADLQLQRPSIPKEENGFFLIAEAQEQLVASDADKTVLSEHLESKSPASTEAAEILNDNSEAMALFRQAMALRHFQVPEIQELGDPVSYVGDWKTLARLAQLSARQSFQQGDEKRAFEEALQIVEFGQRIQNSGGVWIHYLVGVGIKNLGCREIRQMTGATKLKAGELRSCLDRLALYASNAAGLTNTIKAEYKVQANAIRQMAVGQFPGSTNSTAARAVIALANKPFFNPKDTALLFAGLARTNLAAVPLPLNQMQRNQAILGSTNKVRLLMSGNMVGKILAELLLPADNKFMERKCTDNVEMAATRLVLALRCHQIERGSLPSSLDALVPHYLPAIPLDDFDGKPMRYSVASNIVYSVGKDLVDSGGNDKTDIVFSIEF